VLDPLRLRLIVEIGRHGSISRAADACSIGQPAASAHLRTLESAMGQRLVERNGRGSQLTDAGRVVAREGALALATLARLEHELEEIAVGSRGVLRLAACTSFADGTLAEAIARFTVRCPDVRLRIGLGTSREVTEQVRSGEANLGVAGAVSPQRGVTRVALGVDDIVPVSAPGLMPALAGTAPLQMFTANPLILFPPGSSTRAVAERTLLTLGVRSDRAIELHSQEGVKQAAKRGLGIAFLPRRAVAADLDRGELCTLALDGRPPMRRSLFVVHSGDRPPIRLEAVFIDVLRRLVPPERA
jgi:molybdate transport repressor ModE-like protein